MARSASRASARRGSTSVSGPGQKRAASARASAGKTARPSAAARSATCTMSGLKAGRPLAAKMPATARSLARVGAEAVDGLGRKGDELARAQEARGGAEAALGSGKDDGVPLGHRRCLDRPPPGVNCASTLWGRAGPPKVRAPCSFRGDAVAYRAPVGEMLFEGAQPLYASDLA